MAIYWVSQAASQAANMSEQAYAILLAAGILVVGGILWFFQDDEPQLPPGAITGWVPCMAG